MVKIPVTDIRSTQDVSLKDDNSGNYVGVNDRTTTALGINSLVVGEYRSSALSLTNGQVAPLQLTTEGKLKVDVGGTASNPIYTVIRDATTSTYQAAVTSDGKLKVDATISAGISQVIQTKNSAGTAKDVSFQAGNYQSVPSIIVDYTNPAYRAIVDASGRLQVSLPAPLPPPGTTGVNITEYSGVAGTLDNVYVIPNGATLFIQRFSASAEVDTSGGNVVELWYDPNGTGVGMTVIDAVFVGGNAEQHDLAITYIGNGTRAIRMRRSRLSGGTKSIFGRWEGYY